MRQEKTSNTERSKPKTSNTERPKRKVYKTGKPTMVYIGNLRYNKDEADIKKMFNKFGAVKSVRLITDSKSEQSKGIAFVEMPNSNAATEAIEKLNGAIFGGRTLKVSIAAEREEFKTPEFKKGPKTEVESEAEGILEAPKKRIKRKRDKGLKVLFNYLGTK